MAAGDGTVAVCCEVCTGGHGKASGGFWDDDELRAASNMEKRNKHLFCDISASPRFSLAGG